MDDLDAFIDYVDAVDDTGEVTVLSGVDSGNRNNGRRFEPQTRSTGRAFAAMPSSSNLSYRTRNSPHSSRTGHVEISREDYWERNQPKYEKTDVNHSAIASRSPPFRNKTDQTPHSPPDSRKNQKRKIDLVGQKRPTLEQIHRARATSKNGGKSEHKGFVVV
jgi:hypothetical protein